MRILFAHDHRLLREGLRRFLCRMQPKTVIYEVESFDAALLAAETAGGMDLALFGQAMPGLNGTSGILEFRSRFPITKVVLLTTSADPLPMLAAISVGATGVISKNISGHNLVSALRLVMSGEIYLPSDMVMEMAALMVGSPATTETSGVAAMSWVKFSPAETIAVPLLLDGLSNKSIAERLGIEESAVKARLRGIYRKIGAANRAQAVLTLQAKGEARSK